jgi:hypothetical protein
VINAILKQIKEFTVTHRTSYLTGRNGEGNTRKFLSEEIVAEA